MNSEIEIPDISKPHPLKPTIAAAAIDEALDGLSSPSDSESESTTTRKLPEVKTIDTKAVRQAESSVAEADKETMENKVNSDNNVKVKFMLVMPCEELLLSACPKIIR